MFNLYFINVFDDDLFLFLGLVWFVYIVNVAF